MLKRFIGERLRRAAARLVADQRLARMLSGAPVGEHAARAALRSWHRYENWRTVWIALYGWGNQ